MKNKNSYSKGIIFGETVIAFLLFTVMLLFIWPQLDIILFNKACDNSFASMLDAAMNYGNGRFIGNFMLYFTARHYEFASVIGAAVMSVFVWVLNKLFFKSNVYTFPAVALLVAAPSAGMVSDTYFLVSALLNYVPPVLLMALCAVFVRNIKENKAKIISYVALLVCGIASCLFSENSTAVIVLLSIFTVIYGISQQKKINLYSVVYFVSALTGTGVMLALPKITKSAYKMDEYRQMMTGVMPLVKNSFKNFAKFCDAVCESYLLLIVLVFAMILLVKKLEISAKLKKILYSAFSGYAVVAIVLSQYELDDFFTLKTYSIKIFATVIFILAAVFAVFCIKDKTVKLKQIFCGMLCAASVVVMFVSDVCGPRTFYLSYCLILAFAVMILDYAMPKKLLAKISKPDFRKCAVAVCSVAVVAVCCATSVQGLYNFDYYVMRTKHLHENYSQSEAVKIPILPFDSVSREDEAKMYLAKIYCVEPDEIEVTYENYVDNREDYQELKQMDFTELVKYAVENYSYKNPNNVYIKK